MLILLVKDSESPVKGVLTRYKECTSATPNDDCDHDALALACVCVCLNGDKGDLELSSVTFKLVCVWQIRADRH